MLRLAHPNNINRHSHHHREQHGWTVSAEIDANGSVTVKLKILSLSWIDAICSALSQNGWPHHEQADDAANISDFRKQENPLEHVFLDGVDFFSGSACAELGNSAPLIFDMGKHNRGCFNMNNIDFLYLQKSGENIENSLLQRQGS